MGADRTVKASKWLAKHLRHAPDRIGLHLDEAGLVDVDQLLSAAATHHFALSREELNHVVATNNKARYEFDPTGTRVRARQGHSIDVDLGLEPRSPPPVLYHGTAEPAVSAILQEGLRPMRRLHVHLSPGVATAVQVGRRHGRPAVFVVDAAAMSQAGALFWISANGVWLTDAVPAKHLTRLSPAEIAAAQQADRH